MSKESDTWGGDLYAFLEEKPTASERKLREGTAATGLMGQLRQRTPRQQSLGESLSSPLIDERFFVWGGDLDEFLTEQAFVPVAECHRGHSQRHKRWQKHTSLGSGWHWRTPRHHTVEVNDKHDSPSCEYHRFVDLPSEELDIGAKRKRNPTSCSLAQTSATALHRSRSLPPPGLQRFRRDELAEAEELEVQKSVAFDDLFMMAAAGINYSWYDERWMLARIDPAEFGGSPFFW